MALNLRPVSPARAFENMYYLGRVYDLLQPWETSTTKVMCRGSHGIASYKLLPMSALPDHILGCKNVGSSNL
jgi:hypothetical protein